MDVAALLAELKKLAPEREYILPPLLGLKDEMLVREFSLRADGSKTHEDPLRSWTVSIVPGFVLAALEQEVQAAKSRQGSLFVA
jgi:hypothetical protein